MSKAGELDWSDLFSGKVGEPEHSLSKSINGVSNTGGENITKEDLLREAEFILSGFKQANLKSPSKQEFEGVLKSMIPNIPAMTNEEWNNKPNAAFQHLKNIKVQDIADDLKEFGKCKSFNDSLTKEELARRNVWIEE